MTHFIHLIFRHERHVGLAERVLRFRNCFFKNPMCRLTLGQGSGSLGPIPSAQSCFLTSSSSIFFVSCWKINFSVYFLLISLLQGGRKFDSRSWFFSPLSLFFVETNGQDLSHMPLCNPTYFPWKPRYDNYPKQTHSNHCTFFLI